MMAGFMANAAPAANPGEMEERSVEALRSMMLNGLELQKMAEKLNGTAMAPIMKRVKEAMAEQKAAKE
jgi:hypothetical protein